MGGQPVQHAQAARATTSGFELDLKLLFLCRSILGSFNALDIIEAFLFFLVAFP